MEEKYQARLDLIKVSRARNMAARKEADALAMGLGDAKYVPRDIANSRKELNREFRPSPLKGRKKQTTILRIQQSRQRKEERSRQAAYNPKVKGLEGVPGVETDAEGVVRLQALREQRPDIFQMRPMPIEGKVQTGRMAKINELRTLEGRADPFYDNIKK